MGALNHLKDPQCRTLKCSTSYTSRTAIMLQTAMLLFAICPHLYLDLVDSSIFTHSTQLCAEVCIS